MVKYLGQPTLQEWQQMQAQLAAARSALEWMRDRDNENGSLPVAFRQTIDHTLSTLAQEPAGQSEANNMAGVAEQSGAGAPETSVRCGAPAASNTGKPVAYMTAYGFDNWMAGDGPESHVLMRGEGVGLPRVALYADAQPVEWECLGRKQTLPEPGECNWPDCGCDPHATKVIESLVEQGWQPAVPAGSASPGVTAARAPDEATEFALRSRARKLLTNKGWTTPGSNISLHSAIELLTAFGMELSRAPETDRCAYPECGCDFDATCNAAHPTVKVSGDAAEWQPIETAPKDGSEIWLYREDSGPFLGRWVAPCEFLTDGEREAEAIDDDEWGEPDWFYADFVKGGRVTDGAPTLWHPLPALPLTPEGRS